MFIRCSVKKKTALLLTCVRLYNPDTYPNIEGKHIDLEQYVTLPETTSFCVCLYTEYVYYDRSFYYRLSIISL